MGQGNVKLLTVSVTASVKSIGRSGAKWSLRDFLTGPWEQTFLIMCRLLANGCGTPKASPWASDSEPQTNPQRGRMAAEGCLPRALPASSADNKSLWKRDLGSVLQV